MASFTPSLGDGGKTVLEFSSKTGDIEDYVKFDYDFYQIKGKWTHIAVSVDKDTDRHKLYINGSHVDTKIRDCGNIAGFDIDNFCLGAWKKDGIPTRFSQGIFSDLRIWSVERTAEEIAANMANGSLIGNEAGLLLNRKLNEKNSGTVAADSAPGDRNGTIHGGTVMAFCTQERVSMIDLPDKSCPIPSESFSRHIGIQGNRNSDSLLLYDFTVQIYSYKLHFTNTDGKITKKCPEYRKE